jgi:hypothetical protein
MVGCLGNWCNGTLPTSTDIVTFECQSSEPQHWVNITGSMYVAHFHVMSKPIKLIWLLIGSLFSVK